MRRLPPQVDGEATHAPAVLRGTPDTGQARGSTSPENFLRTGTSTPRSPAQLTFWTKELTGRSGRRGDIVPDWLNFQGNTLNEVLDEGAGGARAATPDGQAGSRSTRRTSPSLRPLVEAWVPMSEQWPTYGSPGCRAASSVRWAARSACRRAAARPVHSSLRLGDEQVRAGRGLAIAGVPAGSRCLAMSPARPGSAAGSKGGGGPGGRLLGWWREGLRQHPGHGGGAMRVPAPSPDLGTAAPPGRTGEQKHSIAAGAAGRMRSGRHGRGA